MRTAPNKIKAKLPSLKRMDFGGPNPNDQLDAPARASYLPNTMRRQAVTDTGIPARKASGSFMQTIGNNQNAISAVGDYGAATIDTFAPVDKYGVRSNGAALGSGALSGAAKGAAVGSVIGPEGTLIGAGVGAVVGGVSGLLGNEKANKQKIQTIQNNTISQLQQDQAASNARIAGNPSLKYGNMNASYYRFGGVMKSSPPALPRATQPLPAVQPAQRLMPNITESPNRQMSKRAFGGNVGQFGGLPNAIRYNATKLYRPEKSLKAQKNQILKHGGMFHPKHVHQVSTAQTSAQPVQAASVAPQANQIDPGQIAQMQQMMQQQGMPQKANGGSIHINPANRGKFNATKAATGKTTEQLTHSSNPITRKRAIFAQNASHWNKKADGGQVEPLSSQDVAINGPSHENGGVKFPSAGVELEGGETVNNGFVFSKKLGFAKPAEAIARQLGKAEKRPDSDLSKSTISALQRKTDILKVHQEVAKQAAGIPNDLPKMAEGGPMPKDTSVYKNPNGQPLFASIKNPGDGYDKRVALPNGNVVQSTPNLMDGKQSVQILGQPAPAPTQTLRQFQMGTPGKNLPNGTAIPEIKSPTGRRFKFGGKLNKMADGGDPWSTNPITDLINKQKIPVGNNMGGTLNTVTINGNNDPADQQTAAATMAVTVPPQVPSITPVSSKINDIAGKVSPFLSNFVNATTKLPLPPVPVLNTEITPNLVDYSASRNEAVRANRSANASARTNLNSGAAVSAATAANLAGQTRAVSQINEAENNQNAQIRNSVAAENAQIRAGNTAAQNNYQNELVQRQIKAQNLKSANMANVEEKIQGMARDNKLENNEHTKLLLTALADPTGASWRGARSTFAKYLSPDEMKIADAHFAKVQAMQDEDRADAKKTTKLQQAILASQVRNGKSDANKSVSQILGVNPPSTIFKKESDKYDRNGNLIQETRTN